jgi:hypothetical protein
VDWKQSSHQERPFCFILWYLPPTRYVPYPSTWARDNHGSVIKNGDMPDRAAIATIYTISRSNK